MICSSVAPAEASTRIFPPILKRSRLLNSMLLTPPSEVRIVRLVTSVAKHALGVRDRIDLGKALRLGSVFFMAAPAEVGDVGQLGHIGDGVVRMFGQGSVAGLATNSRMLSPVMHLGFFFVAGGALASAGIGNGQRADHVERARPVVSVFPKVLGHHGGAENQEDSHSPPARPARDESGVQNSGKSDSMPSPNLKRYSCPHLRRAKGLPQVWLLLFVQDRDQSVVRTK